MIRLLSLATALLASLGIDDPTPDVIRQAIETFDPAPAPTVTFRDLWESGDLWHGKTVTIEGRVVRQFERDASLTLPALTETWIQTADRNLICLVHARLPLEVEPPQNGTLVRFQGRFLGRLTYQAGDEPRLAPWLAGPTPPAIIAPPSSPAARVRPGPEPGPIVLAALIGLLAAAWTIWINRRRTTSGGGPSK